ncbi:efflux RND transporter periplasmic adaptor subunit [Rapidithrix thailandica]|uniref:Efflux RND transporter periplasmic adaptor subunit n=1 Tax=Rapidithrix thailandica TaxID=413964 RepID=A0AAW9S3Y0_9BACT
MKSIINSIIIFSTLIVCITSCGAPQNVEEGHSHEEEHAHVEGQVSLTKLQREAIELELGNISYREMNSTVSVNGILEVPPQNEAKVSSYLGGNIDQIKVIEGDKIRKGQVLAWLSHPDFIQIQQDYLDVCAQIDYLKQEYERKQKLFEEKVSSGKEFQKAKSAYNAALFKQKALAAKLKLLHLSPQKIAEGTIYEKVPIKSPIRGFVKTVQTVTGQYVPPQQELFEIVDNSHIHADFMVYEKDVHKVKEGQGVRFSVTSLPNREFTAEIYSVSKAFESDPKAVHLHAEIHNKQDDLIPGMYIQGKVIANDTKVLALPEGSVVTDKGKSYIFIKEDQKPHEHLHKEGEAHSHSDERDKEEWAFKMMEVTTGIQEEGYIEIKPMEELAPDAPIVTKGAYYLLADMLKSEAGHSH